MLASIPREHNKLPCIHGISGTSLCSGCDPVYPSHYKISIEIPEKVVFNLCIYFLGVDQFMSFNLDYFLLALCLNIGTEPN